MPVIEKDPAEEISELGTPRAFVPERNDTVQSTCYWSHWEVDDSSGGRFTNALEDSVGESDVLIPGTRHDDSSMPMDVSTLRPSTSNGLAPEEGETVAFNGTAPDGHQSPAQRKSNRARKPSLWLWDSVTYAARAGKHQEPQTYQEAFEGPKYRKWGEAIREEFGSHVDNSIRELAKLPPGKNPIKCK